MPYIAQEDRMNMEPINKALVSTGVQTAGELQYVIALAITEYLSQYPEVRYQYCNDVMGALSGASQEFYRRVVGPYEDKCIVKNGDVPNYVRDGGEEY